MTQSARGIAQGYLTASSARVFGAALARQFRADHGRASYGTGGMFASGVSIAPAGTSPAQARPAPRARPDFPMRELTVTGTNEAGQPDTGDQVVVVNAADWHTFGDHIETDATFYHGAAKYTVPAGTYWAFAFFPGTSASTLRLDILPQFTVRGRHTWVHLSARAATTVTEQYDQEVPGDGQVYGASFSRGWTASASTPRCPVPMPGEQVRYLTARPDVAYDVQSQPFGSSVGEDDDSWFTVRPGQHLTEDWNAGPLHPQPTVQLLSGSLGRHLASVPTARRVGRQLQLDPTPFSDNTPGHFGGGYFTYPGSGVKISGSYAVYQNGVRIAHGNPVTAETGNGLPPVTLSPKRAAIRFVLTTTRHASRFPQSSSSRTVWTWHSAPRPRAEVPLAWYCGLGGSRRCAVQPMLTLTYHVHGLRPEESTAPGRQVIGLSVGHLQLSGHSRITKATMQVSFNGGHTWHPATVTPAEPGQFTASFTAPAGVGVTLRTSASDAAGGSITETIQDGYRA